MFNWDIKQSLHRYITKHAEPDFILGCILSNQLLDGLETADVWGISLSNLLDAARYVRNEARMNDKLGVSCEWYGTRMKVAMWSHESVQENLRNYVEDHQAPGWCIYQALIGEKVQNELAAAVQDLVPTAARGNIQAVIAWLRS